MLERFSKQKKKTVNMKIVAISDLHNRFPKNMPKGDILTVSGDLCFARRHDMIEQKHHLVNFINWCNMLLEDKTYLDVVFIPGNHDGILEDMMLRKEEDGFRKTLPSHIHYLRDSMVDINGIKFYGISWTLPFCDWFFNIEEGPLDEVCKQIPAGVDVILSHGPAYGLNDRLGQPFDRWAPTKLGSNALLKHLKRVKPSYLLVGHIHSGDHKPIELVHENQVIKSVNVSILSEDYQINYKPFQFEINKKAK